MVNKRCAQVLTAVRDEWEKAGAIAERIGLGVPTTSRSLLFLADHKAIEIRYKPRRGNELSLIAEYRSLQ